MTAASRYRYVAFEGCDGAGKSTIRRAVSDVLESKGYPCIMVGRHAWLHVPSARILLDLLDGRANYDKGKTTAAFQQDYEILLDRVIEPALRYGNVLQDRCLVSEAVYNEVLYQIPAEETFGRYLPSRVRWPDAIVYVDVGAEEAERRLTLRGHGRQPRETLEHIRLLVDAYRRVLIHHPPRPLPSLLVFENETDDWPARVRCQLVPALERLLDQGSDASR